MVLVLPHPHANLQLRYLIMVRFFEARNNSNTAPLATWFNGGPGCTSMMGLFEENGPCHFVNGESKPSLNEHSWNNEVNMLYIDQPIGVGFSYGNSDVSSTETAAPYVWKFLQAFYAQFPQYENRDFGIFTEVRSNTSGISYIETNITSPTADTTVPSSHRTSKSKMPRSSPARSKERPSISWL